ncbi:hypothetical protein [Sphingomonas endolithica]|uniref:hypothetical protein n=1 Tax=Sphingomonas endolithica TaxID=2972485 RepID=UPI0021AFB2DB|nr:hypothetical protein [Sphingomonas sp. ZFBP2030]
MNVATAASSSALNAGSVARCSVTQDADTFARSAANVRFPVSATAAMNAARRAAEVFALIGSVPWAGDRSGSDMPERGL